MEWEKVEMSTVILDWNQQYVCECIAIYISVKKDEASLVAQMVENPPAMQET